MIFKFEVSYPANRWLVCGPSGYQGDDSMIRDTIERMISVSLRSQIILILYLHSGSIKHKRPNEMEHPSKVARTETSKQLSRSLC